MKLHFRALGSGPPLVILHGPLGSLDNWMPMAQVFAAQFHVHLLDLRNHGQSPHAPEFDYEVMARDLSAFLDAYSLAPTHLLGHSMGGKAAMRFAQLHPHAVRKLVVVDMSPRAYPVQFEPLLDAMLGLELGSFQRREEVDSALQAAVPERVVRQFLLKNLGRDQSGRFHWKPNLASIRANYDHVRGALPADASFTGPALFVRGENSGYVRDEDMAEIRMMFPTVRFETIRGAGHWVHADAPGLLARAVIDFLSAKT